ncbi:hypothetical protein BpHYR1_000243, partial [Brachionus plicatilis]
MRKSINKCSNKIGIGEFSKFYAELFSHKGKIHLDSHQEVRNHVNDYFSNSAGYDKICNEFYNLGFCKNLCVIIASFFNAALHHGYLPDSFNVSIVNPIPKGRVTNEPSDFRPISVSNSFATIFEAFLERSTKNAYYEWCSLKFIKDKFQKIINLKNATKKFGTKKLYFGPYFLKIIKYRKALGALLDRGGKPVRENRFETGSKENRFEVGTGLVNRFEDGTGFENRFEDETGLVNRFEDGTGFENRFEDETG